MLKSLVRENRTQGSARGRSGNRPSYLDEITSYSWWIRVLRGVECPISM
jgi:hypothetical protein